MNLDSASGISEIAAAIVVALVLGFVTGKLAERKGESFVGWFVFGTLLFILALPLVLFLPANQKVLSRQLKCPYCGALFNPPTTACPKCNRAHPEAFWNRKASTGSWEKTVDAEDEVTKWAKNQSEAKSTSEGD